MTGRIAKLETLGAVDGPGVRAVAFLQGCPLRCACCHNPETWDAAGGEEIDAETLAARLLRYRPYFGRDGGVTLSGGEPLLQAAFAAETFQICRAAGAGTVLDTSGCLLNREVERALSETDLVLLDLKYTDEADYRAHTGGSLADTLRFLAHLQKRDIPVWLRQVSIPGLTDGEENLKRLAEIAKAHSCVKKVQLLPFRTLCAEKYERLGMPFPLAGTPQPDAAKLRRLNQILQTHLK